MDEKDQKIAEAASEPRVEAVEIEDGDLDVVTGGLISRIMEGPPTDPCITSIG
jgi:hypothetical protein